MNSLLRVAEKFQRKLNKKAGVLQHIEGLIANMLNGGYTDEDIFGMVEDAILRVRSGEAGDWAGSMTEMDLAEFPGPPTERYKLNMVAEKFMRKLGQQMSSEELEYTLKDIEEQLLLHEKRVRDWIDSGDEPYDFQMILHSVNNIHKLRKQLQDLLSSKPTEDTGTEI